ncbi:MAG: GGDEF domain-containing protein [Lachnospiraceae bacterium]|nr:GGDEF domain-containing protein [Lachnospiraceae bacterium]
MENKKISRQGIMNILAAVSLKLLIAAGIFAAFGLLRAYSVETCLRTLEQETKEAKNNIYQRISLVQDNLKTLANIIGQEGLADYTQAKRVLSACENIDMASRLGILLPDNQILQQDGTLAAPMNGITFDALEEKGSFITNIEPDNVNPDESVLFCNVPIVTEGKTEGILFGVIDLKDGSEFMEVDTFDGKANLFVVDVQNMNFIMDTLHGDAKTSDVARGRRIKKGYSEEKLMQDFSQEQAGMTAYFSESVEEYLYTAYEPVGIQNWFVLLAVPESVVLKEALYTKKILFWLGFYEALMLLVYIWWDIIYTRKEMQAKEKMATTDLLTNLKNRNAYEQALGRYAQNHPDCLTCVYADANGLHELNNSQGHLAGDKMLQSVADALVEAFGQGKVYRIGGDEFLAFTETDENTAEESATKAKEKVSEAGYHVSVGTASGEKATAVTAIVKAAEKKMYEDKRQYYMSHGDRRKMR